MHRLTKLASKLYPRWWRERYGDEFAALLEDARPGLRGTLDIARNALWAQVTTYTFKRTILAGALAGIAVAVIVSFFITPQVASTGNLILIARETPDNAPRVLGNEFQRLTSNALSDPNLTSIIRKLDLYQDERTRMQRNEILELMKRSISISMATRATNSTTVAIRFEYSEPRKALLTVEELTTALQRVNRETNEARPEVRSFRTALPTVVIYPARRNAVVTGLGLGIALGLVAHALMRAVSRLVSIPRRGVRNPA
jgi:capsular polysaccharide biosynthesis protein